MIPYQPREDSYLLAKYVKKYAFGTVLEIGTGSGIQAITAAKLGKVKSVLAVDVQEEVIEHCKLSIKSKKVSFRQSDLFENVAGKFDTIIFNPPYLPEDVTLKDITVDGGKKGYEILERFFEKVNDCLKAEGIILVVFSSLTNRKKVDDFIAGRLLEHTELERQKLFMEELYVYLIKKSDTLKKLEQKGVKEIKKLTKGHRGLIFTGKLGNKKIAVKIQRKDIGAKGTVDKEAKVLKLLNRNGIGPKLLFSGKDFFAYEFIEWIFIEEFLEKAEKSRIIDVLKDVFTQCYKLDKLKINKEEMQHPYKHVIVGKNDRAFLIDFERAKKTKKPSNVTQFCQYVGSGKVKNLTRGKLGIDRESIIRAAREYKKRMDKKSFGAVLNNL